ncbi:hypothetical protein GCM10010353_53500 [Streptomyces chryseus]|nr:hypothetical protein GCM10010353_53500 [Streptomyces chryseus]
MRPVRPLSHAAVRAAAVFTLAAGLTVPALVTAPAAHAAPAADVAGVTTFDDGRLNVALAAQALWVKVDILASAQPGAEVLASTDDLTWESTGSTYGWATTDAPALPEGTALGDYPVAVTYRLPGGKVQRWQAPDGTYSYKLRTGVEKAAFDRASLDYDHRTAVLSGTATTYDPRTGERTPARAGTRVAIQYALNGNGVYKTVTSIVMTDAAGAFSLTATPVAPMTGVEATVVQPAADTDPDNALDIDALPIERTKYRITAKLGSKRVQSGDSVRVTGRAERLTADGWKPFAGETVVSASQAPDHYTPTVPGLMGSAKTAADGTFGYGAKATRTTEVHTFLKPSAFLQEAPSALGSVAVPQKFKFTDVKISIDAYGALKATGKFAAAYCENEKVVLQSSTNGRDGWAELKKGTTQYDGNGSGCSFTLETGGFVNAHYRVAHAETDRFVGGTSTPVRVGRTATKFASFKISNTRPAKNASFTASGTLQRYTDGKWRGYGGAKVTLVFKPKSENQWYWVSKGKTTSGGKYSLKGAGYADGDWVVVLEPDAKHFYTESKKVYVNVR